MLDDATKKTIQSAYSTFIDAMKFKPRKGQRLMIAHVANTLGKLLPFGGIPPLDQLPPVVAVEAGTGTGKTLAYATAAVPIAKAADKKLVVATATVALQEQIIKRDFPLLLKNSNIDFEVAIAKGRRRYVCLAKLKKLSNSDADFEQSSLLFGIDSSTELISKEGVTLYPELHAALEDERWSGDRDDWPVAINQDVWMPLTADNTECSGRRCPHVADCVVFKARDAVDEADVIVTNHDLVLADMGLGGGVVLPPPEETIYIFDEAHNLAEKALSQFTADTRLLATQNALEKTISAYQNLLKLAEEVPPLQRETQSLLKQMASVNQQLLLCHLHFLDVLDEHGVDDGDSRAYRYSNGLVPDHSIEMVRQVGDAIQLLLAPCRRLSQELEAILGGDDPYGFTPAEAELWFALTGSTLNRLEAVADLTRAFCAKDSEDKAPRARWLKLVQAGARDDISVHCSAVDAAEPLRTSLWERAAAVCLTSATLQALGRFDRIISKLGLPEQTAQHIVPSPFNHAEHAELRVFNDFCDVTDRSGHTDAIATKLRSIIGDSLGVLVLFSARSQLNDVYEMLGGTLQDHVLCQDDYTKHALVEKHRETIDAGKRSIIFGLASMAEGMDLPGAYCTHVVIAKLPFAVPNEPVAETEAEWFTKQGRNYFMEVTVPEAAIKLVQASGRLLRSETDQGVITLLDKRVVTKRYGSALLQSLPPYRVNVCKLSDIA